MEQTKAHGYDLGMKFIKTYLLTAIPFLVIDAVWLGSIITDFFKANIGHLMADTVNFPVAAGFYLLYAVGIVFFAVKPALDKSCIKTAFIKGALFGFFCYGTYDMTNLATLKDWPAIVAVVDITWGTILTGTSALIGYTLTKKLTNSL